MTAAGTIQPAKTLVIGAGVAGLQAIATAKRLGSQVHAFDVRPVVKEQVESLGAKFVEVESEDSDGVGEGGYAKETSEEYKAKQALLLKEYIAKSGIFSYYHCTYPRKTGTKIITKDMVDAMNGGSAIMDLASENGGNCEYTQPGKVINHNGIIIDGSFNIPGTMSIHASQVYAKNVSALVTYLCPDGQLNLDLEDEIVSGAMFTHKGEVVDERTKDAIEGEKIMIDILTVFILAIFVGNEIINKVPPTLHTPLMSGSNAISGIAIVGAILATQLGGEIGTWLGLAAVIFATINVVGGFMVTGRMLKMFKKK